jgi:hypothetical protein
MILDGHTTYYPVKDKNGRIWEFNELDKVLDFANKNVKDPVVVNILHTSIDEYVRNEMKDIIDSILEHDEEMENETLTRCIKLFHKLDGKTYLSLYCKQTCRIMAIGRNSEKRPELKEAILSFVSIDHDDEEMKKLGSMKLNDLCDMFEFKILVHTDKFKNSEEPDESHNKNK